LHLHIRHIPRIKPSSTDFVGAQFGLVRYLFLEINLDQIDEKIALKALLRLTQRLVVEKYSKNGHKGGKELL
jgi:hypothetical protein